MSKPSAGLRSFATPNSSASTNPRANPWRIGVRMTSVGIGLRSHAQTMPATTSAAISPPIEAVNVETALNAPLARYDSPVVVMVCSPFAPQCVSAFPPRAAHRRAYGYDTINVSDIGKLVAASPVSFISRWARPVDNVAGPDAPRIRRDGRRRQRPRSTPNRRVAPAPGRPTGATRPPTAYPRLPSHKTALNL